MRIARDAAVSLWIRLSAESGQTLAEYGVLISVIAVVVILAAILLGTNVSNLFSSSSSRL